jgi:hypothetical protein
MGYPTVSELRGHIGVDDTFEDGRLVSSLEAAVRDVEAFTGRRFVQDAAVSARTYRPESAYYLRLPAGHDISTTTGLIVKTDDSSVGTYGTTWTINTDFVLEPFDGVGYDGSTGWPYTRVVAVGSRWFPRCYNHRATVQITAKWGWATTPEPVKQAVLLRAAALWKRKDAPYAVAGFGDLGLIRVREDPDIVSLLSRYMHGSLAVIA